MPWTPSPAWNRFKRVVDLDKAASCFVYREMSKRTAAAGEHPCPDVGAATEDGEQRARLLVLHARYMVRDRCRRRVPSTTTGCGQLLDRLPAVHWLCSYGRLVPKVIKLALQRNPPLLLVLEQPWDVTRLGHKPTDDLLR